MEDSLLKYNYKPCECDVHSEEHHHLDRHTTIPWPLFLASFKKFIHRKKEEDTSDHTDE